MSAIRAPFLFSDNSHVPAVNRLINCTFSAIQLRQCNGAQSTERRWPSGAIRTPPTIIQPASKNCLRAPEDYYVGSLWNGSLCRRRIAARGNSVCNGNKGNGRVSLPPLNQLNVVAASWIIYHWPGLVNYALTCLWHPFSFIYYFTPLHMLTCDRAGDIILKAPQFTAVALFKENGSLSDGNWKQKCQNTLTQVKLCNITLTNVAFER